MANDKELKKKKSKGHKIGWILCGLAGCVLLYFGYVNRDAIIKKVKDKIPFGKDKTAIEQIAQDLPLDEEGVVSITFPVVDRTKYDSIAVGFEPFYVDSEGNLCKAELEQVGGKDNVIDFEKTSNGEEATNYLGIADNYANYLEEVKAIKAKILARDKSVISALESIDYEVPDLYLLASGYQLYCDDPSLINQAKVAEKHEDGSVVYCIPASIVDKFVGVRAEVCNLIVQYDTLNEQMIDRYYYYFGDSSYGLDDEVQADFGR